MDAPHHVRREQHAKYREGLVTSSTDTQCHVNVGLHTPVTIHQSAPVNSRVTVAMSRDNTAGRLVSPTTPRQKDGWYWGYQVRIAPSISKVWSQCPFSESKYDLIIGTSERGDILTDTLKSKIPRYKHALIVFGGVQGIETAVDADQECQVSGEDAKQLFSYWLNVLPKQGSRTMRTEEALLVGMGVLHDVIQSKGIQNW